MKKDHRYRQDIQHDNHAENVAANDRFALAMARAVQRGEESVKPGSAADDPARKAARDIRW